MIFRDLCYVSRGSRITVRVREGNKWIYYPENYPNTASHDYTGLSWLTRKDCKEMLEKIVTNVEPTALNYMNVSVV